MWTNTDGAVLAGLGSLDAVLRKLKEELKIELVEPIASYKRKKIM